MSKINQVLLSKIKSSNESCRTGNGLIIPNIEFNVHVRDMLKVIAGFYKNISNFV